MTEVTEVKRVNFADTAIQYKLQFILALITLIPFILVALIYIYDWWKNRNKKEKQEEEEARPLHFHFQLYLTCLIHSINFMMPPYSMGENGFTRAFNAPLGCFLQTYLNVLAFDSNLLVANFISIVGNIMFFKPETIIKKRTFIKILSYLICWVYPITTNILKVGFADLSTGQGSNFCWYKAPKFTYWTFKGIYFIYFVSYLVNTIMLKREIGKINSDSSMDILKKQKDLLRRFNLIFYVIFILFVIMVFATVNQISGLDGWFVFTCDCLEIIAFPIMMLVYTITESKWEIIQEIFGCSNKAKMEEKVKILMDQNEEYQGKDEE